MAGSVLFLFLVAVIAIILCRKNRSRAETISSDVNPVYNIYYIEADPVAEVSTYGYMWPSVQVSPSNTLTPSQVVDKNAEYGQSEGEASAVDSNPLYAGAIFLNPVNPCNVVIYLYY